MTDGKRILVCNDDGIHSPGLRAAVEAAALLGQVTVLAPSTQQTSMARSLHGAHDEKLQPILYQAGGHIVPAFHCDCSPATVVQHGLNVLFPEQKPDLLISGINYGENLGSNITHSGTLGAALQGVSNGIPGLAVSLQTETQYHYEYGDLDWQVAAHFLKLMAEKMLTREFAFDVDILKVDVPVQATKETPWRVTRVARDNYFSIHLRQPSLESTLADTELQVNINYETLDPQSDIYALLVAHEVSVSPISLDMTSRVSLAELETRLRE